MKFRLYAVFLLLGLLSLLTVSSQDFSNKGKEFWLSYSYHVGMVAGGPPQMTLYITSDVNTGYSVEIYGVTTLQSGSITAGQVVTVSIPNSYFINDEGRFSNRTIRVLADKPSVVYSYITRQAASGATLCLPTNVLGREYYTSSFTQLSNENNSNSYITIIAVEDNTTVEITPTGATKGGWQANVPQTINLNKGDIYQVLGTTTGFNGVDLSGTRVRSIASGSGGCKRIAVFSGSGKIRIPATGCTGNSSDNLYQQLYPVGTWGKKFLTVPSYSRVNNYYRIFRSSTTGNVYLNGVLIPAASFTNNYYQFFNATPNSIESSEPISVVQYFTTENCDGNFGVYDPDMIVLNPVEQNIDKVTLVSTNLVNAPAQHHIHVIMRNGGTGISSFKIDGVTPAGSWVPHPADANYSYLYLNNVTQGYHRITSDSGFNAIAYGYASYESYGYSAGANVKDLYQFISVQNQYATVSFPASCQNSPFYFSMTFPYQPTEIKWIFNGLFPDVTITNPTPDSMSSVNGKQLYWYKLPNPYTITAPGTYPIKVVAQNPTSDGCSGEQEILFDLQVFERPVADFNFTTTGCVSDPVQFSDNANTNGRPIIQWSWNFGGTGTSNIANPSYQFTAPGTHNVQYSVISDIGCLSDTVTKTVVLNDPPLAKFGVAAPFCVGKALTFADSSTSAGSPIVKWFWSFGDGTPQVIATTNAPQTHTYTTTGTFTVTLKVEVASGCQSAVFSRPVTISPNPVASFTFGDACLPPGTMQYTNGSTISDGTQGQFAYQWTFSDGGNSTLQNPTHNYTAVGPHTATLQVTSNNGCFDDTTITVNTIYAQPVANFNAPAEVCFGTTVNFTDQTTAANSTITQWQWNFGDGNNSSQQNPTYNYTASGTYTVTLTATSAIGCVSTVATKNVIVNALPVSNFNISAPNCINQNITFTDASTSASGNIVNWTWDLGDATNLVNNNNNPFTHSYSATGTYNVTLRVESDKGCISTPVTKPVVVSPLPKPGFILPDNCLNDPFVQFTDTSSIIDGTESQFSYLWNFGDPNANAGNPNTSTSKNPQHRYSAVGNYNVTLTITSGAGCSATITQAFAINGALPQSIFSVNGGNTHCSNNIVTITNNSTVDFGRLVKLEIFWDYTNDPTNKTTVPFPTAGATFTNAYPEFYTPATKTYTVKVVAYSGDNCLSTTSQTITMQATPQVVFDPVSGMCLDAASYQVTQGRILNILPGGGVFSGTGINASGLFTPQNAGVGTHTIRYTYTGMNGCINYKEQTISVFAVPTISAGPDRFVLEGGNAVLLGTGTGNNLSYVWSPTRGLSNANVAKPIVTPTDDITYTLTVTSGDGCVASDQVFVKLLKTPTIPNTFSPNGDGVHDRWEIQYLESYPGCIVEIFNRYGQLVFQSKGYSKSWDGTFKGKDLPAGTYYYIIDPKNGRRQMTGFVDIIR